MYKNASANLQARATLSHHRAPANSAGIDQSAFVGAGVSEIDAEYDALVDQKQDLQRKKTNIKAEISLACARRREHGGSVSASVWSQLQKQNLELSAQISEVDVKITEVKRRRKAMCDAEHRRKASDAQNSFEFIFFTIAKEMLSGPVFDRLTTAALHRLGEQREGTQYE